MKTATLPRIDKLQPGTIIDLDLFNNSQDSFVDRVMFLGIEGEGDERRAKFLTLTGDRETVYDWEAYRSNGRWVWGSGADRISLVEVVATPADLLKR